MRRKDRRLPDESPEINLVPVLDMVSLLIQVMLINAQFGSFAQIASEPGRAAEKVADTLSFQVEVAPMGYRARWTDAGTPREEVIPCVEPCSPTDYNDAALGRLAMRLKAEAPDQTSVVLRPDPAVPFEVAVRAMDAVRGELPDRPLFPDVVLGL